MDFEKISETGKKKSGKLYTHYIMLCITNLFKTSLKKIKIEYEIFYT